MRLIYLSSISEAGLFFLVSSVIKMTAAAAVAAVMTASPNAALNLSQALKMNHFLSLPPPPPPPHVKAPPTHLHRDGKHARPSRHHYMTQWSELLLRKPGQLNEWQADLPAGPVRYTGAGSRLRGKPVETFFLPCFKHAYRV